MPGTSPKTPASFGSVCVQRVSSIAYLHGAARGASGWVQSEANRYDTVRQVVHSLHRYEVYGSDGTLERTSMLRLEFAYLYPADIRRLLTAAGFRDVIIRGGFDGREFTRDGEELVVESS